LSDLKKKIRDANNGIVKGMNKKYEKLDPRFTYGVGLNNTFNETPYGADNSFERTGRQTRGDNSFCKQSF